MELQRVIADFLGYQRVERCASACSLAAYESDLRLFMKHWALLELPAAVEAVTTRMVRQCLGSMHSGQAYKTATINRRIDTVRSLLRFAVELEYIEEVSSLRTDHIFLSVPTATWSKQTQKGDEAPLWQYAFEVKRLPYSPKPRTLGI